MALGLDQMELEGNCCGVQAPRIMTEQHGIPRY